VLRDLREMAAARQAYEEALQTYRRLAQSQPGVYLPDVAMTLNNLGNVLRDLREMEAARQAYEEAISLRERHGLWLDAAEAHYNWGLLEEGEQNQQRALELFEACVERCERGMSQLAEREHRDVFKAKIEPAYERLIDHYARLAAHDGRATRNRLVGLMESLRRVETVVGMGEAADDHSKAWQQPLDDLMSGRGELSDLFRKERCAFVWVHATRGGVVFVILTPENCQVKVAERGLLEKFWEMFEEAERVMRLPRVSRPRLNQAAFLEAMQLVAQGLEAAHARRLQEALEALARLQSTSEAVFDLLPNEVKPLLAGDEYKTVFLAPCSATMNLPFEMVRVPHGWEGKAPAAPVIADSAGDSSAGASPSHGSRVTGHGQYVGLRRVMPRVHGLTELAQVIQRHPNLNGARKALVVGNPLHHGFPHAQEKPCPVCEKGKCRVCGDKKHCGLVSLEGAKAAATALKDPLRRRGFCLIPHGDILLDEQANAEAILSALADEELIFWAQNGHGGRPTTEDAERVEYLALAGRDRLLPYSVARLRWKNAPVVHQDCCVVGTTRGRGGGRFDGHPTAALLAGASCVLSSVHALWDDTAKEFSERLYGKALDAKNPFTLSDALLQTRREMAAAHHDNPLIWATTVLWGNPWARLA
jgi:tetratricopeptide (TPR) repeat protein